YDLPVQALIEQPTACGTGVCMSCVLPVVGSDGVTRIARACTDGPVFRADLVRWGDVNTIPFDALGAPGWKPPRPIPTQDPRLRSAPMHPPPRAPPPPAPPRPPAPSQPSGSPRPPALPRLPAPSQPSSFP